MPFCAVDHSPFTPHPHRFQDMESVGPETEHTTYICILISCSDPISPAQRRQLAGYRGNNNTSFMTNFYFPDRCDLNRTATNTIWLKRNAAEASASARRTDRQHNRRAAASRCFKGSTILNNQIPAVGYNSMVAHHETVVCRICDQ